MAELITVTVNGGKELERKFAALGRDAIPTSAASLYQSGQNIMSISKGQYVPVETGTLRSTGRVDQPITSRHSVTVTLGFGGPAAPYALAVHENPRAGRTGGVSPGGKPYRRWAKVGQWKYLETPVKENSRKVVEKLKTDLDRRFRQIGGR